MTIKSGINKYKFVVRLLAFLLAVIILMGCSYNSDAASKVSLNKKKITIHVGSSYKLKLNGSKAVSWKSSKKNVATINSKGKVTAKKKGSAVITCTAKNGKKYKCKVVVKNHIYDVKVISEATKKSKGSSIFTCKECGETFTRTTIYDPSEEQVRNDILAMKKKYPEGYKWTTDDYAVWGPDIYYDNMQCTGYGCVGFAFIVSDAAFGKNKSKKISGDNWYKKIRVGDIVRINNDSHSVIVLEKKKNSIVVVEGAYNYSVHWGREIPMSEVKQTGTYLITRYP